jgi:hypothetical protein
VVLRSLNARPLPGPGTHLRAQDRRKNGKKGMREAEDRKTADRDAARVVVAISLVRSIGKLTGKGKMDKVSWRPRMPVPTIRGRLGRGPPTPGGGGAGRRRGGQASHVAGPCRLGRSAIAHTCSERRKAATLFPRDFPNGGGRNAVGGAHRNGAEPEWWPEWPAGQGCNAPLNGVRRATP